MVMINTCRRAGLYCLMGVMSLLAISGCNDSTTETTTSLTSQISHQQSLSLNVSNRVDETEMSNLELLFVFDVANQNETFTVRVQDVLGREVAGFDQGEAFQSNVVVVPESGIVPFTFDVDNASDVNGGVAKMTVIVRGDGFFSNSQVFDLTQTKMSDNYWIEIVPKSEKAEEATTFAEERVDLDGHVTSSQVDVATVSKDDSTDGGKILDGATAKLSIPAGTGFIGEDGQPFTPLGEVSVSMMLFSADPKGLADDENNPLYLFPGGLSPDGFDGELPSDITSPDSVTFISAGFVAIEIGDESGNKVSSFDGEGVTLAFEVPKSTINPQTGEPLSLDDGTIPIWSYTDSTGKWRYEGDAVIEQENENTFTVSKPITHLSYYNLDWYGQDRCQLDVDVVDANGAPNNQKLRLSFAKAGGGWAYKPSGWGDDPEKLNINRVPAFAGHFDLLDSQGNSLLASIEVDGEVIEVADGSEGLDLDDFCFGVSSDSTKSFKATLNIVNPPRIDIETGLSLVCPIDETKTQTVDSGYYYLYSGYSYESSGEVNGDSITFSNLVEDGLYRLYYYGGQTWAQVEFTAKADTTTISLMSLQLCDKIDQAIKTRLVCTDDDMAVTRFKAAPEAYFWMYNQDYSHYLWGRTDSDGNATQSDAVESIEYMGSAYSYFENRYYWGERTTATTSADNAITFDIQLPSSNEYCLAELPIDYLQTFVFAENTEALADGVAEIIITVQERDEFGTARESNSGDLTLSAEPAEEVMISGVTSNGDGTYSAKVTSTKAQEVVISGKIDDNALGGSATVEFIPVLDTNSADFSLDKSSASADGVDVITVTLQLKDKEGDDYTSSGGAVVFDTPNGLTKFDSQDNGDGSYTVKYKSSTSGSYTVGASLDGSKFAESISFEFTPVLDLSNTEFTRDKSSANADGSDVITVTIQLKDTEGNNYTSSGGTLQLSLPAGVSVVTSQDNSDGTYTVSFSSSSSGTKSAGVSIGGNQLSSSISLSYAQVLNLSAAAFSRDKDSANADGSDQITVMVQLKDTNGADYTSSAGEISFSVPSGVTEVSNTDNGDGSYTAVFTTVNAGTYTCGARIGSTQLANDVELTFNAVIDLSQSTLQADITTIAADGNSTAQLTVTLKDYAGNAFVPSSNGPELTITAGHADKTELVNTGDGVYTSSVSASVAGEVTVTATYDSGTIGTLNLTFEAVAPSASQSTITSDISTFGVGGAHSAVITVALKKADGSAYTQSYGELVLSPQGTGLSYGTPVDNGDGTYTVSVTADTAGSYVVSAAVGDLSLSNSLPLTVTQVDAAESVVTPTELNGSGDITITLKDSSGTDLGHGGHVVTVDSSSDAFIFTAGGFGSFSDIVDNNDGTYSVSVTCLKSTNGNSFNIEVQADSTLVGSVDVTCP